MAYLVYLPYAALAVGAAVLAYVFRSSLLALGGTVAAKAGALGKAAEKGTLIVGEVVPGKGPAAGAVASEILGKDTAESAVDVLHRLANWVGGVEPVVDKPTAPTTLTARTRLHNEILDLERRVQVAGPPIPSALRRLILAQYLDLSHRRGTNPTLFGVEVTSYSWVTIEALWLKMAKESATR